MEGQKHSAADNPDHSSEVSFYSILNSNFITIVDACISFKMVRLVS
jgi:hypothetical protein